MVLQVCSISGLLRSFADAHSLLSMEDKRRFSWSSRFIGEALGGIVFFPLVKIYVGFDTNGSFIVSAVAAVIILVSVSAKPGGSSGGADGGD